MSQWHLLFMGCQPALFPRAKERLGDDDTVRAHGYFKQSSGYSETIDLVDA